MNVTVSHWSCSVVSFHTIVEEIDFKLESRGEGMFGRYVGQISTKHLVRDVYTT